MIPKRQFKRAVERFEIATRRLKCHRKCASVEGRRETASIMFEFRAAKRELLELGNLLITGEMPNKAYSPKSLPTSVRVRAGQEPRYGEPKTTGIA